MGAECCSTHAFLRAPDGTFTTFDAPGALRTFAQSINTTGAITGYYSDASGTHGFLRAPDGTFTAFDIPPGVSDTFANSINRTDTITGYLFGAGPNYHGFVRAAPELQGVSTVSAWIGAGKS